MSSGHRGTKLRLNFERAMASSPLESSGMPLPFIYLTDTPALPRVIATTLSNVKCSSRVAFYYVYRVPWPGRLKSQRVTLSSVALERGEMKRSWSSGVSRPRAIRAYVALLSLPLPGERGGGGRGVILLRCLHCRCVRHRGSSSGNFHCHLTRVRCYYRRDCTRGKKLFVPPFP